MKKQVTLGMIAIVFVLTGCEENYLYEATDSASIASSCEEDYSHEITDSASTATSCEESYSHEETGFLSIFTNDEEIEIEAVVVQCEEGTFHPDDSYMTMANTYLALGDTALWSMYRALANDNGTQDYNVTIDIDGNNYTVVREEPYEIGQYITVTRVNKTQYK